MPAIALPDPAPGDGVVRLRAWTDADVAWLVAACQDPEIPRWTGVPSPFGEADARAFVSDAADGLRRGDGAHLAIASAVTARPLGAVGLSEIDHRRRVADVGYWVAAGERRRGLATRALRLMARWAFADLGLERLELRSHRLNLASQAVARGAGFAATDAPRLARPGCDGPAMLVLARGRG